MQPDAGVDEERDSIIDAAYTCLSEPHSGPVPVAAILARAGMSTRAFYRHFESKDALFLALLRQVSLALAGRLDRVADEPEGPPAEQLHSWIGHMFRVVHDPRLRVHLMVIDSEEVRAAKGYREARERAHVDRERSLMEILRRGLADGSFPTADPEGDASAISAVVSRELAASTPGSAADLQRSVDKVMDFALRALGADRSDPGQR